MRGIGMIGVIVAIVLLLAGMIGGQQQGAAPSSAAVTQAGMVEVGNTGGTVQDGGTSINASSGVMAQAEVEPVRAVDLLPRSASEAAARFGGAPAGWRVIDANGWEYRGDGARLTIPVDYRIDYAGADGGIYSCGDVQAPGTYGAVTVAVVAATVWYVPGETRCPSWTTYGQFGS